jgi:MinD-like ATPase involved in chromosome partitioning or flagellar assembly
VGGTENRGYLCERGEGEPPRGLAELLRGAGAVNSAGTLGGFTAPQTSHADVIGSVGAREELTAEDVVRIRQVLDRYYRITVTDTGNNHLAGAYVAAVATADAVLIPVTPTPSSIEGALRTLVRIRDLTADSTHLDQRVVAMITHPGGLEIPSVVAELPEALREYGAEVVEVPYDVELRRDGEITLDRLTQESRRAWTAVAARVVEKLLNAPETLLVRV